MFWVKKEKSIPLKTFNQQIILRQKIPTFVITDFSYINPSADIRETLLWQHNWHSWMATADNTKFNIWFVALNKNS